MLSTAAQQEIRVRSVENHCPQRLKPRQFCLLYVRAEARTLQPIFMHWGGPMGPSNTPVGQVLHWSSSLWFVTRMAWTPDRRVPEFPAGFHFVFLDDADCAQSRDERLDNAKSHQIRRPRDEENGNVVTVGDLKNDTDEDSEEHHRNRSAARADAHDRGHRPLGKHIGYQGEEVSRPGLMSRSRQANEGDRLPESVNPANKDDGHNSQSIEEHGRLPSPVQAPAHTYEPGRKPAAKDAADRLSLIHI